MAVFEGGRHLARISSADIADVYNGMLGLCVQFEFDDCCVQSFSGYLLDAAQVVRFMNALGISRLSAAKGMSCWIVREPGLNGKIIEIHPLHKGDGKPFILSEWQEWHKEHGCKASYSSLCSNDGVTRGL